MKKRVGDEKLIIIGVAARGINDVHLSHLINITYIYNTCVRGRLISVSHEINIGAISTALF